MKKGILLHETNDDVGVAAMDLSSGDEIQAVTLEGKPVAEIILATDVPLGHKVAMRNLNENQHITEYGREIGFATKPIPKGSHVHTHNIKSLRWAGTNQIVER